MSIGTYMHVKCGKTSGLQYSHLSAGICGTRVAVSQQLFIKQMVLVNSVVLMVSLEYALDATS